MDQNFINIIGARENNLRNISLSIPKGKITIFTGVSGSGKSSVVFDTIAQEAGRQLNETFPAFARGFLPKYSQPDADQIENLSAPIIVDQKRLGGNARSTLGTITDINPLLRLLFSRFGKPSIGYANSFSFNDPAGMCLSCEGIGKIVGLNLKKALDMDKSLNEGAILLPGFKVGNWQWRMYTEQGYFDNDKKLRDFSEEKFHKLVYAEPEKVTSIISADMNSIYEGLSIRFRRQTINNAREKSESNQKKIDEFTEIQICPTCHGKRYNEAALSSKIENYNIYDLTSMQVDELVEVLRQFPQNSIIDNLIGRVKSLIDIGLDYVTLNRETVSLSGGESQRVKMVKHLSSSLTNMLYIFDEPSVGLHARDVHRLNNLLTKLRDKGNTVLVVEHDPDVIKIADFIVDMGPKAGRHGGDVVFTGSFDGLKKADTLTGRFIDQNFPLNENPQPAKEFIESDKSALHNLKNIRLRAPKGILTVVTGVAGSGKSTLVNQVFAKAYPEAVRVDQQPVGANIRSNTATFTGVMDRIRQLFAAENKVAPGLFSYNSEGACPKCKGHGSIEINLSFMDNISVICSECNGARYKKEVLNYILDGINIVDVMNMTVSDAIDFFNDKDICSKLTEVAEVGPSYMTLGQPLSTLSGGECQRLKLAKELRKKSGLYILDEPTTGLHMSDVQVIIDILRKMTKRGNTVIVIEHNFDIIKSADWIIDMGPDGGNYGGEILYEGPPRGLLACEKSATAKYLLLSSINLEQNFSQDFC